ncbi:8033_t:CDS:10 [Paraglomus occultum]|uniref:Phosphoinositide phospholipase C n=1 Tax=Paraglomus occultum TaxID=144539 RepID=A0A9N8VMV6_9GLOM|nr:8033_t:CDS:10 [Paraglomus occultum]
MIGRAVLWRKKLFSGDKRSFKKQDIYEHSVDDYSAQSPNRGTSVDKYNIIDGISQTSPERICNYSSFTRLDTQQDNSKYQYQDKFPLGKFTDDKFPVYKCANVNRRITRAFTDSALSTAMNSSRSKKADDSKAKRHSVSPRKSIVLSNDVVINSIVTTTSQTNGTSTPHKHKLVNNSPKKTSFKKEGAVMTTEPEDISDAEKETMPEDTHSNAYPEEIFVDKSLQEGTPLLKVSAKKKMQRIFRIDVGQGRILWDSKKSGKVNIENIKEVRIKEAARSYRELFKVSVDFEPRWFTIVYVEAGKYKTLHLVATTKSDFEKWVDTLERLYFQRRDMMGGLGHLRKRQSIWLKQHWKQADKDGNSKLSFDEVVRLCRQLNIHMSKSVLKAKFDDADRNKNGSLDFKEFQQFMALTEKEYRTLYHKFSDKERAAMTLEGFNTFLVSSDNSIFAPEHSKIFQDMNQPLSHYYINSSHNTYLLGHQLKGESSIEGYIRALQQGCRCVEIDCWDGTEGPIVTHGHTFTSKILFADAINAIRIYAFKASSYPLILSLEVHCNVEQQTQMASIIRSMLGEYLVDWFISDSEVELPSPAALMNKILIKGKNIPPGHEDSATESESTTESGSDVDSSKESQARLKKQEKLKKKHRQRIAPALSDLVNYCSSVKFKGFDYHHIEPFYHMSSFSERVSARLIKSDRKNFLRHNVRHLSRIYPAGFRINSSNYEPQHHWNAGNQMVALNWQTFDLGMQINQAMFMVNGRCGYILKPERLRKYESLTTNALATTTTWKLTIEIISGQQLPKPKEQTKGEIVDPFVEVELLVPGADAVKYKTKTVNDNGFNPIWKEAADFTIHFNELSLVFLRFSVYDEDVRTSEFIASYCIPVASLQPGYRNVPLNDANGEQYLFTSLNFHLADFITLGNGSCGSFAIFANMQYVATDDISYIWLGILLIACGLFFDVMDGKVARWRKNSSILGQELDSLADLISFGMAPATLAFAIGMRSFLDVIVLAVFVSCGIARLARYNATVASIPKDSSGKIQYFEGTPIPISLVLVTAIAFFAYNERLNDNLPGGLSHVVNGVEFHPFVLLYALLGTGMVSKTLKIPKI